MTLAARLAAPPTHHDTDARCRLGAFLDRLTEPADRVALEDALSNPGRYPAHTLVMALRDPDAPADQRLEVSASTINNHRGRRCTCHLGKGAS